MEPIILLTLYVQKVRAHIYHISSNNLNGISIKPTLQLTNKRNINQNDNHKELRNVI